MAGFWTIAEEVPDHLATVEPDGTEITAGDVLARANQLVHGLRALGLEPGDCVATVLPNGAADDRCSSPRCRPAGTSRRSTPALAARDRVHPQRLRGEGVHQPRALRRARAARRPKKRASPPRHGLSPARSRASARSTRSLDRQPTTLPDDRSDGRGDALHVGHHRQAQGRAARARRVDPDTSARAGHVPARCSASRRAATTCTSHARRSTTPRSRLRDNSLHIGHTVVLMDKWTPRARCG